MDAKDTGRRIRTARAWADISQPELAEMLEVSESTVSRWEQGKKLPKRSELFYIAELCGVDRNWFTQEATEQGITALDAAVGEVERVGRLEVKRQERGRGAGPKPSSEN